MRTFIAAMALFLSAAYTVMLLRLVEAPVHLWLWWVFTFCFTSVSVITSEYYKQKEIKETAEKLVREAIKRGGLK